MNIYEMLREGGPRCFDTHNHASVINDIRRRQEFVKNFGYVMYSYPMVRFIDKYTRNYPVLEIGSGKGLLAKLLTDMQNNVIATDNYSDPLFQTAWKTPFIYVHKANHLEAIATFPTSTLLMVHPTDFALEALQAFQGTRFIYIGELNKKPLFDEIDQHWITDLDQRVEINHWKNIGLAADWLIIYDRKT